jgi:hypothetical protein
MKTIESGAIAAPKAKPGKATHNERLAAWKRHRQLSDAVFPGLRKPDAPGDEPGPTCQVQ